MMKGNCPVTCTAMVLLVIGGINWGLVGLGGFNGANWNLVTMLLGSWPTVEWVVYVLVGLSAVFVAWKWMSCGDCCEKK